MLFCDWEVSCRDQIAKRIANGERTLDINLDDFQAFDPMHQDMFQQMPGVYLSIVGFGCDVHSKFEESAKKLCQVLLPTVEVPDLQLLYSTSQNTTPIREISVLSNRRC